MKKFTLVFIIIVLASLLASCAPVPNSSSTNQQQPQPAAQQQNQVQSTPVSNTTTPNVMGLFPVANLIDKDGDSAYSVYEYTNAGMRCVIVIDTKMGTDYGSNSAPAISCYP